MPPAIDSNHQLFSLIKQNIELVIRNDIMIYMHPRM
jgi:hypothetical protein